MPVVLDTAFTRMMQDAIKLEERLRVAYDVVTEYVNGSRPTSDYIHLEHVSRFLAVQVVRAADGVRGIESVARRAGLEMRRG
jgi:hypothetical protein